VNGSYKDNAGATVPPTVTLQVSGAGEFFQDISMSDDGTGVDASVDGNWTGVFTPQNPGNHMVTVKAGDGNQYWVDGRGSSRLSITGNFPYASLGLTALIRFFGFAERIDLSSLTAAITALLGLAVVKLRRAIK
jgi:hypothetical protein